MADTARPAPLAPHSFTAWTVDKAMLACALVPYSLIALGLRVVMARVVFVAGQSKISGPQIPIDILDFHTSIVLPAAVKQMTFQSFQDQYAGLPMQPALAAYLFSYAEFVLPICLLLGFATRFSALVLLVLAVLLTVYVTPDALWTTYVYWFAILAVLIALGPGAISVDRLIRLVYER